MRRVRASDLPFAVERGARATGLYADERADGTLSAVGYWRNGRLEVGVFFSETEAWLQRNDYFTPDEDDESDAFETWLSGLALRDVQLKATGLLTCAFCGKRRDEVSRLIMGPREGICNECVALCVDILAS